MDAEFLFNRLATPGLLKADNPAEWKQITEKHPYFTVAHWMQFAADRLHGEGELTSFSFYKTDPIKFAEWVRQIENIMLTPAAATPEATEAPVAQPPLPEAPPEAVIPPQAEEVLVQAPAIEPQVVETVPEPVAVIQDEPETPHVPQVEADREEIPEMPSRPAGATFMQEHDVDILDMIRDLPNSSPFETPLNTTEEPSGSEAEVVDQVTEEMQDTINPAEERAEEDDRSLMVMMSFTDWLKHFKRKNENEKEEAKARKALKAAWQKEKLAEAADEEAEEIPEPIFRQAMESITIESSLISESLAEILARQGKKEKAIAMYKKLSLRNPEKSTYFADRINELSSMMD